MPVKARTPGAAHEPTFVFKGTVKKIRSATMANVPVDDQTVVARVDHVVEGPAALAAWAGQDITVRLSRRQRVKVGEEMIFHTHSWIYGDSVAVRAIRQEPVRASHATLLGGGGDAVARRNHRVVQQHFDAADLVVSGRVSAVRLPAEPAAAAAAPRRPISEHDPKWREAVVEVDDVHKGRHAKKSVVVRFPASTDVRWYAAPKFRAGQKGFFVLHKEKTQPAKPARGAAAAAKPKAVGVDVYTALHPTDFQPFSAPGGVKALVAVPPKKGSN